MASKILKTVIVFLFFLFPLYSVLSTEPLSVVINEIAWMGTKASSADEWIELYNNTNEDINLKGWGLYEAGGTVLIEPLTGIIKAKSHYLIERTDDTTISNLPASQEPSSWGGYGLKNNGEHLQLLDQNSTIIDEVNCTDGWFAGEASPDYKTMERINPLIIGNEANNWQTSKNPGGTPKAENQYPEVGPRDIEENIVEATPVEQSYEVEPRTVYPSNIFVNEILPSAEGSDAENEWIEIFNENNFEVDVSGWKIRDTIGAITTYSFPKGIKIKPNNFLVLARPETKITLQNSGDGLELSNPSGEIVDKINYEKASLGQSFNRTLQGFAWSTTLTPGKENIITSAETLKTDLSEDFKEEEGQKTENSQKLSSFEKISSAKIGENLPKSSNPLIILLIALGIAISSAIVVLIIKKKTELEE